MATRYVPLLGHIVITLADVLTVGISIAIGAAAITWATRSRR